MPTVLRAHGLRFVIFVNDHPPPHVHVSGRGAVKIAIGEPHEILANQGMSKVDVGRIRNVVREQHSQLIDAWMRIHGPTDQ